MKTLEDKQRAEEAKSALEAEVKQLALQDSGTLARDLLKVKRLYESASKENDKYREFFRVLKEFLPKNYNEIIRE